MVENIAKVDRYEHVPFSSLKIGTDTIDDTSLVKNFAKQIWLTNAYAIQRKHCGMIFKNKRELNANLTFDELKGAKVAVGMDVSQHLFVGKIV